MLDIPVANLVADSRNPRIAPTNEGNRETLRALAKIQGRKLQFLADDIKEHGLNPSELTVVMPLGDDANRYVVLDGNRRLTALLALENPEFLVDVVPSGTVTAIRRLSKEYQKSPIHDVPCVVFKDRIEANHWIELRHTGERSGAGQVHWGSDESDRFQMLVVGRHPNLATQALNFLESRGLVTPEQRTKAPSTLTRTLSSREVRSKMGLEHSNKVLKAVGDPDGVAKALAYVVTEIAEGRLGVRNLYTKEQRTEFAETLPVEIVVAHTAKRGAGIALDDVPANKNGPRKARAPRQPKPLDILIPHDCVLHVTIPRIRNIEGELRRLSLSGTPNAVAVLFRVFIELSVDEYITREGLQLSPDSHLRSKLQHVADDLSEHGKISSAEAGPVRRAATKDSFLSPSVTVMNHWIHNQHMFPTGSDLRSFWDGLQPFVTAVWAP